MNKYAFETFNRWTIRGRRYYFRMVAGNGEKVAQSEGYNDEGDMLATIRKIKANARDAPIVKVKS